MVLVVALLVLGPNRLPDAARSVGRAIGELRRYTSGFQEEIREAFSEPVEPTPSYPPSPPGAPAGATGTEAVAPPQDGGDGASPPS